MRPVSLCLALLLVGAPLVGCERLDDLVGGEARAAPAEPGDDARPHAVACYDAAREQTPLNEQQATALCQGSASIGPVRCFQVSRERTPLSDWPGIKLCRCAGGTAPVACYERAETDTDLTRHQIVARCQASCAS